MAERKMISFNLPLGLFERLNKAVKEDEYKNKTSFIIDALIKELDRLDKKKGKNEKS